MRQTELADPDHEPARLPANKPIIRILRRDDLMLVLSAGWRDFKEAPRFGLALSALYVLGGWALIGLATAMNMHYFIYPLATGFALIAPFVAAMLYEVSRRIETGAELSWSAIFTSVKQSSLRDLGWMALVTTFAFLIWIDCAVFLFLMIFGLHLPTPQEFLTIVLSTQQGLIFLIIGNIAGALIATVIFSITVVSFPLLLDRDIDFVTAMIASVQAVKVNRLQMLSWAFLIGLFLATSLVTGLMSLLLTLPLIGHSTWHLYRLIIEPQHKT
jgi:uncharacterized membrane protein